MGKLLKHSTPSIKTGARERVTHKRKVHIMPTLDVPGRVGGVH